MSKKKVRKPLPLPQPAPGTGIERLINLFEEMHKHQAESVTLILTIKLDQDGDYMLTADGDFLMGALPFEHRMFGRDADIVDRAFDWPELRGMLKAAIRELKGGEG